jgi:hypothetical protein
LRGCGPSCSRARNPSFLWLSRLAPNGASLESQNELFGKGRELEIENLVLFVHQLARLQIIQSVGRSQDLDGMTAG